jgi:glycine cleavage system transcriptional repressor
MLMEDKCHVVITTIGTDRPGIVEEISAWILEQQGNIEGSRMSLLGGEFATLILVSGEQGLDQRLEQSREAFQQAHGLTVFTRPVAAAPPPPKVPLLRYILRATALDHPGIVHQVAYVLRERTVNIVSAATHNSPAPFTGVPVFSFQMEIDIPSTVAVADLRDELAHLGSRDNIDFTLKPATEVAG